ncbi:ABC transporter permease [Arthrospira platensis]|jgi:putative ABC transport system permease protein|uniref:Iron export ABC transporter permease subunit FetB n=1 Tax=Limnospira platensis NIES-46 TaxID=1236695 RepID=A0A5M3T7R9_LIMPL|nr:iron export ABC transporter permease subunit FetB [Arthrospira platensis]AMW29740.1 ABC transporter permease [Arthrospira platensis YZ]KDR58896.1 ABC transporter permease [Arthrospira platensis str. Paraca]MBD2668250.1 iron export ABC transporter permease subunit FetB [Arthrospira platensis FACHB-439]MBD2709937.1 iron export ABC transporter permease subunit FetB [Arthrospira platensis FACHB-835]MDF2212278.1 iron export ABC transporter permease subunit FetB [Arthrospira platensis NCB002]MDT
MSDNYLSLSYGQLGASVLLIIINVALSIQLRLGLERSLAIASLRCVVQLLLVGYILEWLFALDNPWVVLAIALLMAAIAGISAVNRTSRRFAGIYWRSLLSVLVSAFLITNLSVIGIIQVQPWYNPQYLIPLLGMILGNTLNGISLGLDRFMEGVVSNRNGIETLLALGATRWEASHKQIQTAVRTGMIPIINSMMVMGVVSLPGMMTGQILAGASPLDAVRYQIIIVFAIASASALGTLGVVILAWGALFSPSHQLLSDRLHHITKN